GGAGRRPHLVAAALVKAVDHLEQVLGGLVLVREDEDAQPAVSAAAMIEARADVGGAALLTPLEDQRTHPPGGGALRLQPLVDEALRAVEPQRRDGARLGTDLKVRGREQLEVGIKTTF